MNGVAVYRTDEDGTIIATSDGKKITFNVPASETWKSGEPTKSGKEKAKNSFQEESDSNGISSAKPKSQNEESPTVIEEIPEEINDTETAELTYVLNVETNKFHKPSCSFLPTKNRKDSSESRESIISQGYVPCKKCNP